MKFTLVPGSFLAAALTLAFAATHAHAATPPAPAKPLATFRSTNWRVECGNNGTALDCVTTNRIVQNNGEQLAVITVHPAATGGGANALLQLPLGIVLSAPVRLAIDEKSEMTLTVNSCVAEGCIASANLSPSFIASARKGKSLTITFGAPNGQQLAMNIALQGFGLAYDRLTQ